jgi:magnesium transporter
LIALTLIKSGASGPPSETLATFPDVVAPDDVLWVDAEDPTPDELSDLKRRFSLDEYAIEDVIHQEQRPKIEDYKTSVFAVIHIPTVGDGGRGGGKKSSVVELFVFFSKNWFITIHSGKDELVRSVDARIRARGLAPLSVSPSADLLYYLFLDFAVDAYYPILDEIEDRIEDMDRRGIESFKTRVRNFDSVVAAMSNIGAIRERLMGLRRSLTPTRDTVGMIMRGAVPFVADSSLRSFRDIYDHSFQLLETLDNYRDRTSDVRDLYISLLTASTDNIIKLLTVVATIFLPLTLLAGIYGTNFTPGFFEPGSGAQIGFYVFIAGLAAIGLGMLYSFKRSGWV